MLGLVAVIALVACTNALRYTPDQVGYNLNTNQTATHPVDYWGEWTGHQYTPSPENWRFPFYTLFLDRFVNGDPKNGNDLCELLIVINLADHALDDANGTVYEHDTTANQLRHGGDLQGLVDSLDYLQGMGIKAVYIAGSPMMNLPWESDGKFQGAMIFLRV